MPKSIVRAGVVAATAALMVFVASVAQVQAQQIFKQEAKCLSKLGKGAVKLAATIAKGTGKCREDDISGKTIGACPDAKSAAKISKAAAKVVSSAEKTCASTCSTGPDVVCVSDLGCPPPLGQCSAGAKGILFDLSRVGFPGPFCPGVGVTEVTAPADMGTCTSGVATQAGEALVATIYGSITNASGISATAASCLASLSKAAQKLTSTVAKGVTKCRDSINKGKLNIRAENCQSDAKTAAKIAKAKDKLDSTIADKCADADIQQLDLCGNGVAGTADVGSAQACMAAAAIEIADSSALPVERSAVAATIVDAAYPPAATCGDNNVNGRVSAFQPIGEECDGNDDSACPGECLPPGDTFQCTCGDRVRFRFEADASQTDSSAGWIGNSLEQKVGDRSGFIVTLLNCDCAGFAGPGSPNCTGGSGDPICDMVGTQRPYCEWEVPGPHCEGNVATEGDPCASDLDCGALGTCVSTPHCDVRGTDPDTKDEDEDCSICDANSTNASASCKDDSDCGSQCYPVAGGAPTGSCSFQADCAAGEACLGRCDNRQKCVISPDGAPFPVLAANTGVCSVTVYRENILGTLNLVTGEHQFDNVSFSRQYLGEGLSRPCPVCGGICEGGLDNSESCLGRCRDGAGTGTLDACRFDSDCTTPGESCSSESPDCRDGACSLELVCGSAPETPGAGDPCEIYFVDPVLGAMSEDCQPAEGNNITGTGFPIQYDPGSTTHPIVWAAAEPCTAPGFELYECHCPGVGGQPTAPNTCSPACDSGVNFGQACANLATTCAGGSNIGKACDEDLDCPGSSCSSNPVACSGDPLTNGQACATNVDCGAGTCGDACPGGGRCVPLCVSDPSDPDDGICAVGPATYHCSDNPGFDCTAADSAAAAMGNCASTCSVSATACGAQEDCPVGETCSGPCAARKNCEAGGDGIMGTVDDKPGIGECFTDVRNCQPDPVTIEGGTTLNGLGSAEDIFHVGRWCFTATNSAAVNSSSGFPGPGVIRRKGKGYVNQTSIP